MAIRYSWTKPLTNSKKYNRTLCQVWRKTDKGDKCVAYGLEEEVAREIVDGANNMLGKPTGPLAAVLGFVVVKLRTIDLGNTDDQRAIDEVVSRCLMVIQDQENQADDEDDEDDDWR